MIAGSGSAQRVVVVGSSLAGLRACEALRAGAFAGEITLIGSEPEPPYDRPPLSKKVLAGTWEIERVRLRTNADLAALALDLRLGRSAVALDLEQHEVTLSSGEQVSFDGLVIATGATPRRLPGQPKLTGLSELRTLADSVRVRDQLLALTAAQRTPRVLVIGAGFIGLEVAATSTQIGAEVTVLERGSAPLTRALGPEMGAAVARMHTRHGVDVRCGATVAAIEGDGKRVHGVRLATGETFAADVVIVGVGVTPATDWLEGSGLDLDDGILCDSNLYTGADGVFAAGDCCRWHNRVFDPHDDAVMRIEHWTNASDQGAAAARNVLRHLRGDEMVPFESVPYFWSEQFDSRLQFVGRAHGGDDFEVIAGDGNGRLAAIYGWQGRLRGVLGVSMPKLVMSFQAMLQARASFDDARAHAASLA